MKIRWFVFATVLVIGPIVSFVDARAQRGGDGEAIASPAEIQRMFDAYTVGQAQTQLKLGDDQYLRFLPRFMALQQIRRRSQMERIRIIQDLRRLSAEPKPDEAQLAERLKMLQDLEVRSAADIRRAFEAIDQVLDVRQQAQLRAFEELMERRKIDLVVRARQNSRRRGAARGQE